MRCAPILLTTAALTSIGCASVPTSAPSGGGYLGGVARSLFGGGASEAASTGGDAGLWIFSLVGGLTMAAGIAMFFVTGSRKMLACGIGIGLIPLGANVLVAVAFPALKWIVLVATLLCCAALVMFAGQYLGWWTLKKHAEKRAKEIEENGHDSHDLLDELKNIGNLKRFKGAKA